MSINPLTAMIPNPVLTPVKEFVKRHGGNWPRRAFNLPPLTPAAPVEDAPAMRVFCLAQNDGRRFAVRALGYVEALNRLTLLLP